MNKTTLFIVTCLVLSIFILFSCNKENCKDLNFRKAELRIFNSDSINVTSNYEIGFNNIVADCVYPPGIGFTASITHKHLDSLVEFSLRYCFDLDSVKYNLRLDEGPNDGFVDSFYVKVNNANQCGKCSVVSLNSLTNEKNVNDDGSVIKIDVYD